VYFV
jgi:hypothetical protein